METETVPAVASPLRAIALRIFGLRMLLAATLAAIVFFFIPRSTVDPDIWWHLRNAQVLVSTHRFIGTDQYSFTALGAPWMNHEWIAELPFYFGWLAGGGRGVYLVTVLAVELLLLGIFLLAVRRSSSLGSSLLVSVVAAILCTVSYGPRTVLFGWLCLLLELLILDLSETRDRLVWLLPLLFAVWVNTHGSWVIGLVVLAVYVASDGWPVQWGSLQTEGFSRRRLLGLITSSAMCLVALFVNPYGWRLVAYPFNLAFHQKLNIANVQEWRNLDLHSPRGLILLGCLAFLALVQIGRDRSWRPHEIAYLFIGVYSALTYTRFLVLFSVLGAPLLVAPLRGASSKGLKHRTAHPFVNAAILFVLVCLVVGRWRSPDADASATAAAYPGGAIPFLAALHPRGHVFNEYLWGGFLIWHLREVPVFVDSRVDIFEYNGTFKDYLDIVRVKDSLALLNKYGIRYVFFEKETPLVYLLEHTGGWKVDYESGNIILLERDDDLPPPIPRSVPPRVGSPRVGSPGTESTPRR